MRAIRQFRRRLEWAAAERRVPSPSGTGLFCDAARDVHDANGLRVEVAPAPAAAILAAEADALMDRCFHRRVAVEGSQDALAEGFERLGWIGVRHLVMALRRPADRIVDTSAVVEVPFPELRDARHLVTLREPWGDTALAEQLDAAKRRLTAAVRTRFFAARVDGRVAAWCELRDDGRIAQVEDVNTLVELRGRGLGRAVVQRAVDEVRGRPVVFLEALADDWPRDLYARLGFDVVDERWLFTLPASPLARLVLHTPRLELRLPTAAELRELPAPDRAQGLAGWSPAAWSLRLAAFREGRPVGTHELAATRFAATRTVHTAAWLDPRAGGASLGAEMSTAALALAFEGLGAELVDDVRRADFVPAFDVRVEGLERVRGLFGP